MFALVDARGYSMFPLGSAHREALVAPNWDKEKLWGGVVVGGNLLIAFLLWSLKFYTLNHFYRRHLFIRPRYVFLYLVYILFVVFVDIVVFSSLCVIYVYNVLLHKKCICSIPRLSYFWINPRSKRHHIDIMCVDPTPIGRRIDAHDVNMMSFWC